MSYSYDKRRKNMKKVNEYIQRIGKERGGKLGDVVCAPNDLWKKFDNGSAVTAMNKPRYYRG